MREQLERAQFALGNALVYLELVEVRVRMAHTSQPALMGPAVEDLAAIRTLIRSGQRQIGAVVPAPVRARG
jgi:hypothetical protein